MSASLHHVIAPYLKRIVLSLFLFFIIYSYVYGGSISLQWLPVDEPDLDGYKLYYGKSSGNYTDVKDVGNVTTYTLENLSECTRYYIVVTAYDTSGNESDRSNEVAGLPKPIITSVLPSSAEQGRKLTVKIDGFNFENGATVQTSNPGIAVLSTTYVSCAQLQSEFSISETAGTGLSDIDVVNPDGIYGRASLAFEVTVSIPPEVTGTAPADGATNVPVNVHPEISFSEAIDHATISTSTVILLDETGSQVAQAANSPSLNSEGTIATISPLDILNYDSIYKIKVVGGVNGIKDLAGHPMVNDVIQNTGFTTILEANSPVISNVNASNILSTTADINWDTDEPSDSMVEYKPSGSSYYRQTEVGPEMVTSHLVTLTGLEPDTLYEYHVISKDESGNSSSSNPDDTFQTAVNPYSYIYVETEEGEIVSPMQVGNSHNPPAFCEKYVYTAQGAGNNYSENPGGRGIYDFYVPHDGPYNLWLRVYASNSSHSSFSVKVNSDPSSTISASQYGSWEWVKGQSYSLMQGLNHLEIGHRDEQAEADRILFTDDADFVPSELPGDDRTAPRSVSSFSAAPGNGKNTLSWINPPESDFKKTIVRYRTDGKYPKHPEDGFPVCVKPGEPLANDTYSHNGLTSKQTYYYSAFAIDGDKNASVESAAAGTPHGKDPPGQVRNNRRKDKKK